MDRCESGLSLLMGGAEAKALYQREGWSQTVVDPFAMRCGPSTLTTLSAKTDFHYLVMIRALPDVCVAKFGPTFVVLHPTVPLRLVYNNHFCFTVLDAIELPKDSLHGM